MTFKKALALTICVLFALSCFAQGNRGKAELKAGSGLITVDYGRPSLKGRDMLAQLPVGQSWRMGLNQATAFSTPVDLTFGSARVAKGTYTLFLKKVEADKYELLFNSQTGQWGTQHDASKDVAQVPMKKEAIASPVEIFTIDLKGAPKGGIFVMSWGTVQLSAEFQFAQ